MSPIPSYLFADGRPPNFLLLTGGCRIVSPAYPAISSPNGAYSNALIVLIKSFISSKDSFSTLAFFVDSGGIANLIQQVSQQIMSGIDEVSCFR